MTRLRVRFAETDAMAVAHHSVYAVWLEAARVEWLKSHGMDYRTLAGEGVNLAVSDLKVTYRASARFDDEVVIEPKLLELRSRRLCFSYELRLGEGGPLVATAQTIHTPTNEQGRAVSLSKAWLEGLRPHLTSSEV